uniref:Putative ovule protein n=1 Tax=Solanum chacoense TaxID=4108 RepID=A0A0V0GTS1_SOLCH
MWGRTPWVENEKSCYAGRGGLKIMRVKLNLPHPRYALPHCHPYVQVRPHIHQDDQKMYSKIEIQRM